MVYLIKLVMFLCLQIQGQYFESCYNSYLEGFDEFDKENETLEKMLSKLLHLIYILGG